MNDKPKILKLTEHLKQDSEPIKVLVPPRKKWGENGMIVFFEGMQNIVDDRELTGRHLRALIFLMSQATFENFITISQTKAAKRLGISRSNMNGIFKDLEKKDLIYRCNPIGNTNIYKLSSTLGWRGKLSNLSKERKKTKEEISKENFGDSFG